MAIHRQNINLSGAAAFPPDPQVVVPFEPKRITVINQVAAEYIEFSFDGVNVHGRLTSAATASGSEIVLIQRARQLWLRAETGGATSPVEVIAEA